MPFARLIVLQQVHPSVDAHCPQCSAYEGRVMGRAPGEELPAEIAPCPAYAMSDAFRAWVLGQMQREVAGQVAAAGLDRMAVVKASRKP